MGFKMNKWSLFQEVLKNAVYVPIQTHINLPTNYYVIYINNKQR